MPEPVRDYHVVGFASSTDAMSAADRIAEFIRTPGGIAWMMDPMRAVIWSGPPFEDDPTLYLSIGALEAGQNAGLVLVSKGLLRATELPQGRALLLGDARDWHD